MANLVQPADMYRATLFMKVGAKAAVGSVLMKREYARTILRTAVHHWLQ